MELQNKLTGALIGLARATDSSTVVTADTWRLLIEGLAAYDPEMLEGLVDRVHGEKARLLPDCVTCACPCGRTSDYDMAALEKAPEEVRRLKMQILEAARRLATQIGEAEDATNRLFAKALFALGEDWNAQKLQAVLAELKEKC